MKKALFVFATTLLLLTGCKKPDNVFDFSGKMVDYLDCTLPSVGIADYDYGLVLSLSKPDSIGRTFTNIYGERYENCVILYRTRSRFMIDDSVSGSMYLSDKYSDAYCSIHHSSLDLPEGVCYSLD